MTANEQRQQAWEEAAAIFDRWQQVGTMPDGALIRSHPIWGSGVREPSGFICSPIAYAVRNNLQGDKYQYDWSLEGLHMNTVEEWRAVLAGEKYHSNKQQAELVLRSLDAYRPYTKVHDSDVEAIVRFLTARDQINELSSSGVQE